MAHSPKDLQALVKQNSTLVRENRRLKEQNQKLTKKVEAQVANKGKQTPAKRSKS